VADHALELGEIQERADRYRTDALWEQAVESAADVPALLAEVEQLRTEVGRLDALLTQACDHDAEVQDERDRLSAENTRLRTELIRRTVQDQLETEQLPDVVARCETSGVVARSEVHATT